MLASSPLHDEAEFPKLCSIIIVDLNCKEIHLKVSAHLSDRESQPLRNSNDREFRISEESSSVWTANHDCASFS